MRGEILKHRVGKTCLSGFSSADKLVLVSQNSDSMRGGSVEVQLGMAFSANHKSFDLGPKAGGKRERQMFVIRSGGLNIGPLFDNNVVGC